MNCFRPSTVIPLLSTPLTVGKRGSSLKDKTKNKKSKEHLKGKRYKSKKKKKPKPNSPSINISLVNKPGELPLGEHRVVKVESGILPDVGLPKAQSIDYPVELLVTIMILSGPKSMGNTL